MVLASHNYNFFPESIGKFNIIMNFKPKEFILTMIKETLNIIKL